MGVPKFLFKNLFVSQLMGVLKFLLMGVLKFIFSEIYFLMGVLKFLLIPLRLCIHGCNFFSLNGALPEYSSNPQAESCC